MNDLDDLLKKYIGKTAMQNPGENNNGSTEEEEEIPNLATMLKGFGIDDNAIQQAIGNTKPGSLSEALNTLFKEISRETTRLKPIRPDDRGFITRNIATKETENGLEREVERPLIIAACGKVIKVEEIGVKCSICGQYDCKEHTFFCHHCHISLCILHTRFYPGEDGQNTPYCPLHYKSIIENQDTWGQRLRQIKRKEK